MLRIPLAYCALKVNFTISSLILDSLHVFLATGEPPLCMSVSVFFALRNAIDAARKDAGDDEWYRMGKISY